MRINNSKTGEVQFRTFCSRDINVDNEGGEIEGEDAFEKESWRIIRLT